jgi:hypothetical protein
VAEAEDGSLEGVTGVEGEREVGQAAAGEAEPVEAPGGFGVLHDGVKLRTLQARGPALPPLPCSFGPCAPRPSQTHPTKPVKKTTIPARCGS